jgi:hypothetical protein
MAHYIGVDLHQAFSPVVRGGLSRPAVWEGHAQAAIAVIFAAPTGRSTLSGRPAGIGDSAEWVELAPTEIADKFGRTQPQCAVKLVFP